MHYIHPAPAEPARPRRESPLRPAARPLGSGTGADAGTVADRGAEPGERYVAGRRKGNPMRDLFAAIVLVLLSSPAVADQPLLVHIAVPERDGVAEASSDCSAGVVYDDGVFTDFYDLPTYMVMRFDLPYGTTEIDQVCSCFGRLDATSSSTLSFDVVVYDDNGPGGLPGTFLGSVAATATDVPIVAASQFYNVTLAGSGIVLPDSSVYVGVRFDSAGHYVCGDRSFETPPRAIYDSANGTSWTNSKTAFPDGLGANAWGIRVDSAAVDATCIPTAETLCLNNGRFRVGMTFDTTLPSSGNGRAVKLTDETGYFWFFDASNVEVVVKVIDGCTYNDRFWFFAGGLTNVHAVITVEDTSNGTTRSYTNLQGKAFEPIQDTAAFAKCL